MVQYGYTWVPENAKKDTVHSENCLVLSKDGNMKVKPWRGKEQGLISMAGYGRKPPSICMDPTEL